MTTLPLLLPTLLPLSLLLLLALLLLTFLLPLLSALLLRRPSSHWGDRHFSALALATPQVPVLAFQLQEWLADPPEPHTPAEGE